MSDPKRLHYHAALRKIREEFQRVPLEVPPRAMPRWALIPSEQQDLLAHALPQARVL